MVPDQLFLRHKELSESLAEAYRDLAFCKNTVVATHRDRWEATRGLGVTERREECRIAVAESELEVNKAAGEIEALKVELAHVDLEVRYAHG